MSWSYILTNEDKSIKNKNNVSDSIKKEEINEERIETYEITPDELFDEKYGDTLFDILWELREINSYEENIIKFEDFSSLIGDLYEFIKENSSCYFEDEIEEEETTESEDEY